MKRRTFPILIPKLAEVLKTLGLSYEMIFVDDGSSDGSRRILKEMASLSILLSVSLGLRRIVV